MKLRPRLRSPHIAGLSSSKFLTRSLQALLYVLPLVLAFDATLAANPQEGYITGKIADPQSVAVEGVLLKLVNMAGAVISEQRSDAQGKFEFNSIDPGEYQVTAEQAGFVAVTADVSVAAGQTSEI